MESRGGHLRIGELGRRVGVNPELLRAWERRYGLLQPSRSVGSFRLYSGVDEERVRAVQRHLDRGLSASQAAESALRDPSRGESSSEEASLADVLRPAFDSPRAKLLSALLRFDEPEAHAQLDRLFAALATDIALGEIVLPVRRSIGERLGRCTTSVAQEHFASHLLRGRLLGLARGRGPLALFACPPGELHDLPLIMFGIALGETNWRIPFLGADTPHETIESAAAATRPRAVVLKRSRPGPISRCRAGTREARCVAQGCARRRRGRARVRDTRRSSAARW